MVLLLIVGDFRPLLYPYTVKESPKLALYSKKLERILSKISYNNLALKDVLIIDYYSFSPSKLSTYFSKVCSSIRTSKLHRNLQI